MEKNEFQCAACGRIFPKGWSDEKANREARKIWGIKNASQSDEMVVICDDCFHKRTSKEIKEMGNEYKTLNKP